MGISEIKPYVEERLLPKLKCKVKSYNIFEVVENTNVNFIYRVRVTDSNNKTRTIYLKHAKDFVKKLPDRKIPIDRQAYEAKAIGLFHKILGDRVPEIVDLDEEMHILAVTDIGHGTLLADLFKKNRFCPEAWKDMGKSLGKLHRLTFGKDEWIRPPEANRAFNDYILPFRFMGALELAPEPSKRHLAEALKEPTCIVWGDPLRKNIFQTETKTFFFDFECVVRYEPAFDIGYALAELVVESLNAEGSMEKVTQCTSEFIEGYSSEFKPAGEIEHILHRSVKYLAAIMLHRTYGEKDKNSNRLDFREDIHQRLMAAAVNILNSDYKTPSEVFGIINNQDISKKL